MAPEKVTIVGSGNWGSAIARILGRTVKAFPDEFDSRVVMWVYEEVVDGKKLSEVINNEHENVKYLPGKKLPENVVAVTDLVESCKEADVLVFVVPHQHVEKLCGVLKGNVKKDATAISLIKGLGEKKGGGMCLVSQQIRDILGIDVAVLMGANLAPEVANDNFCEATIGIRQKGDRTSKLKKLFHTDNFRINVVEDADTVELCGALKNIVACAAGFSDGLGYGDNTKAAIIRLGLMEQIKFAEVWSPGTKLDTFFESCGVADLVTTCYGGRNRKICEAFVKTKKPIPELEKELLNGQSAQGPLTAYEVFQTLTEKKKLDDFPLFVAVHRICKGELPPEKLIDNIRDHPKYAHI